MAAGDASAFGRKNVAYRVTFPIFDADGDLVTGATGLDSEVSKDGGTFTDATNEATEIATSSGIYYLDLTSTEMNADTVAIIVKTSSSGAKTTALVIYPLKAGDIEANVTQIAGQTASAAGAVTFPGTIASTTNITAATGITVSTNNDKTGYSLSSSQTFNTTGSVGSVTGAVGSVTGSVASVTGNVGGNVVGSVASVTARVTANTDQLAGQTVTASAGVTFPATVSSLTAANVWQTDISGYTTAGYAGTYLKGAGSSGDPWSTALPGTYGIGTAGYIIGTNINATISSRLATSGYTAPLDAAGTRTALGLAAANLDTQFGDLPTAAENADAVWDEAMSGHTTAGTYGGRIPRSDSSNVEVKLTGSAHIAADIHELQPAVIESTHFAAGAIDSNALAADAATEIATAVHTGQLTESYRAAGVAPTLAQVAFEMIAHMGDSAISGTTKTLKKLDGTTAKTFTLDSATTPTSIAEAT